MWLKDVQDTAMYPNRGVLVLVDFPSAVDVVNNTDCNGTELAYTCPQAGGVLACGGLSQKGSWSTEVTKDEATAIVKRCAAFTPGLADAPVVGSWAGLRPSRKGGVRLEHGQDVTVDGCHCHVIHNYGHGGSGVVLSWGCAEQVAELATQRRARSHHCGAGANTLDPAALFPRRRVQNKSQL